MAFHLENGEVTRLASVVMQEALAQTVFKTGDQILDELLETAREKFLNPSLVIRRESLEKLWDAGGEKVDSDQRGTHSANAQMLGGALQSRPPTFQPGTRNAGPEFAQGTASNPTALPTEGLPNCSDSDPWRSASRVPVREDCCMKEITFKASNRFIADDNPDKETTTSENGSKLSRIGARYHVHRALIFQ